MTVPGILIERLVKQPKSGDARSAAFGAGKFLSPPVAGPLKNDLVSLGGMDGDQGFSIGSIDESTGGDPTDLADLEIHGELGPAC